MYHFTYRGQDFKCDTFSELQEATAPVAVTVATRRRRPPVSSVKPVQRSVKRRKGSVAQSSAVAHSWALARAYAAAHEIAVADARKKLAKRPEAKVEAEALLAKG